MTRFVVIHEGRRLGPFSVRNLLALHAAGKFEGGFEIKEVRLKRPANLKSHVTVERTSKRIKENMLWAWAFFFAGALLFIVPIATVTHIGFRPFASVCLFAGLVLMTFSAIWAVANSADRWWNHG